MELTILALIRSFREANFALYCEALSELIPYFFANNNINYARWVPIHLRDMMSLEQHHPQVAREFNNGNFVVHKSCREFSALAIDQAHEQANALIKGDGGAIGVTEDPSALRRWMVAGPEVSRLVADYEIASGTKEATKGSSHHERTMQAQRAFLDKVDRLTNVLHDMGNPFQEESSDLLTLDTKDIAHTSVHDLLSTHYERGTDRFCSFLQGLESQEESQFYKPIKKNKLEFFKQQCVATDPKHRALSEDCHLFSQLFISCQSRQCDLQEFFRYENQSFPAALSDNGKLHSCQKSDLAKLLLSQVITPELESAADAIIIDGSALVNSMYPCTSKTFDDYARAIVLPTIEKISSKYKRVDIVFNVYLQSSLKSETRLKRGKGVRRRVAGCNKIPKNWQSFLRDGNKTELFHFLADCIAEMHTTSVIIVTKEKFALSNQVISLDPVVPCSHEEADTRIFVHAWHAVMEGSETLMIKANDTDVIVIAIYILSSLQELGLQKLWIAFGQGAHLKWIPIHEIVPVIGPEKTSGILFFHAFTGCDVVSSFRGKGKKSAWQTWNVCNDDVSKIFKKLSKYPPTVEDEDIKIVEKFIVTLYDRSSNAVCVNDARLELFARKQRSYQSIPPTRAALVQHLKRATYQASCIWSQALVCQPETQSPGDWGWILENDVWKTHWSTLPAIATNCQELTKCGCKMECYGNCKCYRFGLSCTALCSCTCLD